MKDWLFVIALMSLLFLSGCALDPQNFDDAINTSNNESENQSVKNEGNQTFSGCSSDCSDYRYGNCPSDCERRCVPSSCSGNVCTTDCGGEGSCYCPQS